MTRKVILIILCAFFSHTGSAQDKKLPLHLQHRNNKGRQQDLEYDRKYAFKAKDSFYHAHIVGFTDSSLILVSLEDSGTVVKNGGFAAGDTAVVLLKDMQWMKRSWVRNERFANPFMAVAIVGLAGFYVAHELEFQYIPVNEIKGFWIFEGIVAGITFPGIIIGTCRRTFDLQKKWMIIAKPA